MKYSICTADRVIRKRILKEICQTNKTFEAHFNYLKSLQLTKSHFPFCVYLLIKTTRRVAETAIQQEQIREILFYTLKYRKESFYQPIKRRINKFQEIQDFETSVQLYGILLNLMLEEISLTWNRN